jgi:uncharacterized protein YkwD
MPFAFSLSLMIGCGDDFEPSQKNSATGHAADVDGDTASADAAGNTTKTTTKGGSTDQPTTSDADTEISDTTATVVPDAPSDASNQPTNTGSTTSPSSWQDLLGSILGGGSNGGASTAGSSTPTAPATLPVTPVSLPGAEDCIGADPFICEVEHLITGYTNEIRSAQSPLTYHAKLAFVARDWSQKQANSGNISHSGFPSQRRQVYVAAFGSSDNISINAENVAYSGTSNPTADQVARMFVTMWANSSGHRRNMLGNYQLLGAGVAKRGGNYYATQIFGD